MQVRYPRGGAWTEAGKDHHEQGQACVWQGLVYIGRGAASQCMVPPAGAGTMSTSGTGAGAGMWQRTPADTSHDTVPYMSRHPRGGAGAGTARQGQGRHARGIVARDTWHGGTPAVRGQALLCKVPQGRDAGAGTDRQWQGQARSTVQHGAARWHTSRDDQTRAWMVER